MKKANIILITLCICSAFACRNSSKEKLLTEYFNDTEKCNLKESVYPQDSLGKPNLIYSFKDFIVAGEPHLDDMLSVFNMRTREYHRFLKKGEGPDELLDIHQLDFYDKDKFFVKSTFSPTVFIYSLEKDAPFLASKAAAPEKSISLIYDEDMVISSTYGKKRFSIYNINTGSSMDFGSPLKIDNLPEEAVSHILQGLCTGNPEKKRFAWFSVYGDAFELYDYNNPEDIICIKQFTGIMPVVKLEGSTPVFSLDSKLGVPALASNDDYIFALYNKNSLKDAVTLRDEVFLSDIILVLDWDGNFIKILELDHPVRSISYNKEKDLLFCIGYDKNLDYKVYYLEK